MLRRLCNGSRQFSTSTWLDNGDTTKATDFAGQAQSWLQQGHFSKALAAAEQALELNVSQEMSLQTKVRALWGLHQYTRCCSYLKKLAASFPSLQGLYEQSWVLKEQSELGCHDFTEFYIRGCRDEEVPQVAEFVGPVEIRVTADGRGRGLFVCKDVQKGDLLLVSNAVARVEKEQTPRDLLAEVRQACSASKRTLDQVYSMAEPVPGSPSEMLQKPAPSMELFRPNGSMEVLDQVDVSAVDDARLQSIIDCSRECGSNFVGLWTLPAFINHSCLPNSSVRKFGRTLLVFAARDLKSGEEMVRAYSYCLQPMRSRLQDVARGNFVCQCKRCCLEKSLEGPLTHITEEYLELLQGRSEVGHPDFIRLATELQVVMKTQCRTREEEMWLLASYPLAFHSLVTRLNGNELEELADRAMEAFHGIGPGDVMTLKTLLYYSRFASQRGLELLQQECYATYGRVNLETSRAVLQLAFTRG